MTPAWTFDSASAYHGKTDHLSSGKVKLGLRSLAHLKAALDEPIEQTPAMLLGGLIHTATLEPENLGTLYAVSPKFDRRTKDGKAQAEAFELAMAGKTVVSEDDIKTAQACAASVQNHPVALEILAGAKVESSIYWQDEDSGVKCKARPDAYNHETGTLIDLKSTLDAGPKFARDLFNLGYHLQLAFYSMGIEAIGFPVKRVIVIAVEKSAPFEVGLYELDENILAHAENKVRAFLPRYAEALKTNVWKGYERQIQLIEAPSWAFE